MAFFFKSKKGINKNEKKNNNQYTIIKPACIYRAECRCLPPDSNEIINIECEKCHFNVNLLNSNEINTLLKLIYDGYEILDDKKINHPLNFDREFLSKEYLISIKLSEIIGRIYISNSLKLNTDDYISQIIHFSQEWQYVMKLSIAHTSGMSGGIHWHTIPFTKPYTLFQKKILTLSLAYTQYYTDYRRVYMCKPCLDNDLRDTEINIRDRVCRNCGTDLRLPGKRNCRYYFQGLDDQFISDEDFGFFSVLSWCTNQYKFMKNAKTEAGTQK